MIKQKGLAPNPIPPGLRWRGREIEWDGRVMTAAQWAREFGLKPTTFGHRYDGGWSMERIR